MPGEVVQFSPAFAKLTWGLDITVKNARGMTYIFRLASTWRFRVRPALHTSIPVSKGGKSATLIPMLEDRGQLTCAVVREPLL